MWGIIKGIGIGVGILAAWVAATLFEAKRDEETADRVAACLQELAQELYGRPFFDLDDAQQEVVMEECRKR